MPESSPGNTDLQDVKAGDSLSAKKQNALLGAVRELQEGKGNPLINRVTMFRRKETGSDVTPDVNSDAIGTALVDTGQATDHVVRLGGTSDKTVSEISDELVKEFHNVGQKFFPRDEIFLGLDLSGSRVPIKVGGAEEVWCCAITDITAAAADGAERILGSGTACVYDLKLVSGQWRLFATTTPITVLNNSTAVPNGEFFRAFYFAGRYFVSTQNSSARIQGTVSGTDLVDITGIDAPYLGPDPVPFENPIGHEFCPGAIVRAERNYLTGDWEIYCVRVRIAIKDVWLDGLTLRKINTCNVPDVIYVGTNCAPSGP